MAQGVARATSVCKACGAKIIAGVSSIKWSPAIKGSARHSECYGQDDRFDSHGSPLHDGLDAVINQPANGVSLAPIEPFGHLSEEQIQRLDNGDKSVLDEIKAPAPVSPAAPADPMAAMMAAALAPYLETKLKGLVDENTVRRIVKEVATLKSQEELRQQEAAINKAVKEAIEQRGLVTIAVQQTNGTTTKLEGLQHKNTGKLLRLMLRRKNVYMHGPTGSGKSTAARKCAAAIRTEAHPDGLPFYYVSLNPQSSPTRIEGYQTPHGEYVMTLFRKAYEHGGVFCADEVDNSMGNLWTSINNAIDSDLASFPDGMVKRHSDFVFVGTGNTNLNGDAVYRDRKPLDKATIARFVFMWWPYDLALERCVTLARNEKALPWLTWVHKARVWATIQNPAMYPYLHPRACYDGADLLADGFPTSEVVEMVVFKQTFDQTAMKAALQANPLPSEDMSISA